MAPILGVPCAQVNGVASDDVFGPGYAGSDVRVLWGLLPAEDDDRSDAGPPSARVVVAGRNGRVLVWDEVHPASAAWTVDGDADQRQRMFSQPMVRLRQVADIAAAALPGEHLAQPPRLLVRPAAPWTFLVVHSHGVEAVQISHSSSASPTDGDATTVTLVDAVAGADSLGSGAVAIVEPIGKRAHLVVYPGAGSTAHVVTLVPGAGADWPHELSESTVRASTLASPAGRPAVAVSHPASAARSLLHLGDVKAICDLPPVVCLGALPSRPASGARGVGVGGGGR